MFKKLRARKRGQTGFTLLELLIVIAIIAILSVVIILVLNPAETLKKSRDTQRMSDLSTLKTAIAIYVTTIKSPDLDAAVASLCLGDGNTAAQISYSAEVPNTTCAVNVAEGSDVTSGSTFSTTDSCRYVGSTGASAVDGTGWVPVDFTVITGGSPIPNLPLDPVNTVVSSSAPADGDLVYRYACQQVTTGGKPQHVFEIDAQLESDEYTVTDDKRAKDGGDNDNYYEVGTNLRLIGTGTNF